MNTNDRLSVLIVDDAPDNIEVLDSILGRDYDTCFATNGREALDLVMRFPPSLILLDVIMPDMNGFEVCRHLKANAATRDIPVIFLTSLESAVDEEFGLSIGAEDFIHKPVSAPVVLARVRNHLLLANTLHDLKRHNEALEALVAERTQQVMRRDWELIAAQTATIAALCELAEARDYDTGNHILRTQYYVRALAERLQNHPRFRHQLSTETIQLLFKSAPLHDVGKVAVPDSVLLKPGKLTPEEQEIMKRHCIVGRNAIMAAAKELVDSDRSFLDLAAQIAYCHHERWDGNGYPQGLAGADIPLGARLMAVADVYDALISRRVYKEALPHDEALRILAAGRATQFDPDILGVMLSIAGEFARIAERYRDALETARSGG